MQWNRIVIDSPGMKTAFNSDGDVRALAVVCFSGAFGILVRVFFPNRISFRASAPSRVGERLSHPAYSIIVLYLLR